MTDPDARGAGDSGDAGARDSHADLPDAARGAGGASRPDVPGMVRRAASARRESLRAAATLGSVGMSFTFAVIIGGAIGYWLDKVTGWSPLFLLIFLMVGFAAGALNVHRALTQVNRKPR